MVSDLRSKTNQAALWSSLEAAGLRSVQFVVGIILARLLLPEEFGLIGMLLFFMTLAQVFLDSGFGAALVQRKEITEKDTSSVFYLNLVLGTLAAACLCGLSPWVAAFFKQPILSPLLRLLSLVLIFNAFALVQSSLLIKAIDFKTQTKISLIAGVLSGSIGITMAYRGFGVWSLAVQQISAAAFRAILLWIFNRWRPSRLFCVASLRGMFGYASKLFCSGFLNTVFDNIYYLVIGRLFTPADLGFFARADNLQQLPSTTIGGIAGRVAFPVFSSIQDDPERVKRGLRKGLTMLALVHFPLMIGLSVAARPLVLVLLTEKWAPCIPYLQLLSLVGLMLPLHVLNLNILQALGRSDLFLRLEIIKKSMVAVNILITWRWGIMAIILGQVVISLVGFYLNSYYNKALLNYPFRQQISDLHPYLNNALIMGAAVYLMRYLPISVPVVQLFVQVTAGAGIYLGLSQIFRFPAYLELRQMIAGRLRLHRFS